MLKSGLNYFPFAPVQLLAAPVRCRAPGRRPEHCRDLWLQAGVIPAHKQMPQNIFLKHSGSEVVLLNVPV